MLRNLLLFILVACVFARWSPWKEVKSECSDTCGMCGIRVVAERNCLSRTCEGPSQQFQVCGESLCIFPRKTCCEGYMKGLVESRLECIPKEEKKEELIII